MLDFHDGLVHAELAHEVIGMLSKQVCKVVEWCKVCKV